MSSNSNSNLNISIFPNNLIDNNSTVPSNISSKIFDNKINQLRCVYSNATSIVNKMSELKTLIAARQPHII